jgi:peptidoglycan/LPS O-acetylase OafA/YrhL
MRRILELDIIRAFAIILIVFSHLPPIPGFGVDPVVKYWSAIVGVSLFLFISGIVLTPPKDIKRFYKRRALRVYPPYLIIMGVYVLLQYAFPNVANTLGIYLTPAELVINLAGAQAVLNVPSYGVLWFVGLILVYYAVYPALGSSVRQILLVAGMFIVACFALRAVGWIIPQLIYYWPVFVVGVLLSNKINICWIKSTKHIKPLLFIARLSYPIYLTHYLVIGLVVLLLSSASVAPLVAPVNNTTVNITANVTKPAKLPHYTLYYFTMSAPCPAGVQMQKDVTAWAKAHPSVEFSVKSDGDPLATKYDVKLSPTVVMLKNGKLVGRWVGIFSVNELDKSIK